MPDTTDDLFKVRGRTFYDKPFFNCILSTNIAIYKYLAGVFFEGNLERIVWASTDMMFRKRQEQLAERSNNTDSKTGLGILDMPFCSVKLTQIGPPSMRPSWWNPALHIEGMWIEELGRRIRLTPASLNYEMCFCCNHDSDYFRMLQEQIWIDNMETIIESFVDAAAPDGTMHTLKNIIIYDMDLPSNQQFSERDWLEKNRIQTIAANIGCQTWLIAEDKHHRYAVTKKVIFDFLNGAGYYNLIHGNGDVDSEAQRVVWDLFMGDNPSQSITKPNPENLKQESSKYTVN